MAEEDTFKITLGDVFREQQKQRSDFTAGLHQHSLDMIIAIGEAKTVIATLAENVRPQAGINAEIFRRVLTLESKVYWVLGGSSAFGVAAGVISAWLIKK